MAPQTSPPKHEGPIKKSVQHWRWIEPVVTLGLTFGLGLLLRTVLPGQVSRDLSWATVAGDITWLVGGLLALHRFLSELHLNSRLRDEMATVNRLAEVVDLSADSNVGEIRNLVDSYLRIQEPEFQGLRDRIVTDAQGRLLRLAQEKTSDDVAMAEYYDWLLPALEVTKKDSTVRAVSTMMPSEWNDSPPEREFLRQMKLAAKRGVEIHRIFIMDTSKLVEALDEYPGIREHAFGSDPDGLHGYIVDRDWLERSDPALFKRLGDGFIVFDNRVALVDLASPEGQARGHVTMNKAVIGGLLADHGLLRRHADPLVDPRR